ncbi:amidohydrolase family protein [Brevundimonas sp. UBA7534]|uniref:amidohydrolase family protein n=1 Tax=Brevundimonas sp. UBA7534 TaxID=1946138 RepID=UPI0025C719F3|nr:amidohydrolase family protein [Brevundimonas sp. UBA7534]
MQGFTRKDFLSFSAAVTAAVSTGLGNATGAQAAATRQTRTTPRRYVIKGADLLTMDPALGEMTATDVLIENGRIAAIQPGISASDAVVVDGTGKILMPGMNDGHRHVWECIEAGRLVKTEPARYGTYQSWKMKVMACLTPEDHYMANYIGGLQCIDSGVTGVLDYAHGQQDEARALAAARGLKDSGVAGWFAYQDSHTITYGPGDTVSLAEAAAMREEYTTDRHWRTIEKVMSDVLSDASAPLQMGVAMSNSSYGKPLDVIRDKEIGRARALGLKMIAHHAGLPSTPYPAGTYGHRGSGILDLYEADLLGPEYHGSHGAQITDDEFAIMARVGAMHCASAVGEFPYRAAGRGLSSHWRARRAGVATGIGIDVGVALTEEYFEHVRGAFWSMYLSDEGAAEAAKYKSEDVLDYATRLGARGIRHGDVAGAITVGKRADLVLLDTDRFNFPHIGGLADRVVNFARMSDIDSVWVAGRMLKHDGQMIGVDWTRLKQQMIDIQTRVWSQAETITFI